MDNAKEYTIEFLSTALQDMTEIVSTFIMLGSKQGAIRIKAKFNEAAEQIQRFPYSGITVPDDKLSKSGFRIIVIEKYLMFYKVFDNESKVIVYHIINGTRDYPTFMKQIYHLGE